MNRLQCNKNINTELSIQSTKTIPPWLGRSEPQLGQRRNKRKEKTTHTHTRTHTHTHTHTYIKVFNNASDTVLSIMYVFISLHNRY